MKYKKSLITRTNQILAFVANENQLIIQMHNGTEVFNHEDNVNELTFLMQRALSGKTTIAISNVIKDGKIGIALSV